MRQSSLNLEPLYSKTTTLCRMLNKLKYKYKHQQQTYKHFPKKLMPTHSHIKFNLKQTFGCVRACVCMLSKFSRKTNDKRGIKVWALSQTNIHACMLACEMLTCTNDNETLCE